MMAKVSDPKPTTAIDDECLWGETLRNGLLARCKRVMNDGALRILFHGERGTGKGALAKHCHKLSKREGRFEPFNAAAITETLALSELFGHEKNAFTGAGASRDGLIRSVAKEGGTLFLDELDKLSSASQFYLLRFLETGEVRPMGSDRSEPAGKSLLLIAAARDIEKVPEEIRDRFDPMFFVPPLRDRFGPVDYPVTAGEVWPRVMPNRSDIAAIMAESLKRIGVRAVPTALLEGAVNGYWPGNVRELCRFCKHLGTAVADSLASDDPIHDSLEYKDWPRRAAAQLMFRATGMDIDWLDDDYLRRMHDGKVAKRSKEMIRVEEARDYIPRVYDDVRKSFIGQPAASLDKYRQRYERANTEWRQERETQWRQCPHLAQLQPESEGPDKLPWNLKELETMRIQDAVNAFGACETKEDVARKLGITAFTLGKKLKSHDIPNPWAREGQRK